MLTLANSAAPAPEASTAGSSLCSQGLGGGVLISSHISQHSEFSYQDRRQLAGHNFAVKLVRQTQNKYQRVHTWASTVPTYTADCSWTRMSSNQAACLTGCNQKNSSILWKVPCEEHFALETRNCSTGNSHNIAVSTANSRWYNWHTQGKML